MMRSSLLRCLCALYVLCTATSPAPAQTAPEGLTVGADVAPLDCTDVNGKKLQWDAWHDRGVIVFFHSEDMSYSRRGLELVVAALSGATDLTDKAALLLVTNGKRELGSLTALVDPLGMPAAVTVDPDRTAFRPFHVVAFPTIYCVGKDRKVASIAKGYGPLLGAKVLAGARLAAGAIDKAGFDEALSSTHTGPTGADQLRVARVVRMAQQLVAASMLDEARDALLKVVDGDAPSAEALTLLARIYLLQGRKDDAKPWIDRLQALGAESTDLRFLRAELALLDGEPDKAWSALEGLDEALPRVALLRGRVHEQAGRYQEAARLYRRALESMLEKQN